MANYILEDERQNQLIALERALRVFLICSKRKSKDCKSWTSQGSCSEGLKELIRTQFRKQIRKSCLQTNFCRKAERLKTPEDVRLERMIELCVLTTRMELVAVAVSVATGCCSELDIFDIQLRVFLDPAGSSSDNFAFFFCFFNIIKKSYLS